MNASRFGQSIYSLVLTRRKRSVITCRPSMGLMMAYTLPGRAARPSDGLRRRRGAARVHSRRQSGRCATRCWPCCTLACLQYCHNCEPSIPGLCASAVRCFPFRLYSRKREDVGRCVPSEPGSPFEVCCAERRVRSGVWAAQVDAAAKQILDLMEPGDDAVREERKRAQLRELALLNGTVRVRSLPSVSNCQRIPLLS